MEKIVFISSNSIFAISAECPFSHPDPQQNGGGGGYGGRPPMDNDFNDFRRKLRDDFQDRRPVRGGGHAYDPEFPTGGPYEDYYETRSKISKPFY